MAAHTRPWGPPNPTNVGAMPCSESKSPEPRPCGALTPVTSLLRPSQFTAPWAGAPKWRLLRKGCCHHDTLATGRLVPWGRDLFGSRCQNGPAVLTPRPDVP